MRILHINCNYIGTSLHQLMIEKLDAFGIENDVFVPTYDKKKAVIEVNSNVCVSECFNKWNRYFFDYKQSKIVKTIEKQYDIKSYDLIHAYTLFTDGNAARVLSKKYGIPYVVAVRNTDVNDFFAKRILLRQRGIRNLKAASEVFFLSQAYQKQVFKKYIPLKEGEIIKNKTEIIPNGIDDFWLHNLPSQLKQFDKSSVRLVYVGSIDRNKNITATQKAMALLREQGINSHLTVIGKIKQQKEYEIIVEDEHTTYIPAQQKDKLIELYRKNDIFVMPSIHESFGLVYAEAMSQGLPVVYTKGQGFDGQFDEGIVGFSVNARKPCTIAQAIVQIIDSYYLISNNCKKAVLKFSWGDLVNQYEAVYKKVGNIK